MKHRACHCGILDYTVLFIADTYTRGHEPTTFEAGGCSISLLTMLTEDLYHEFNGTKFYYTEVFYITLRSEFPEPGFFISWIRDAGTREAESWAAAAIAAAAGKTQPLISCYKYSLRKRKQEEDATERQMQHRRQP